MAALLLAALATASPAQESGDGRSIPWTPGLTYSRTSVDDDIRSVLRGLLAADGFSVIFRPEVEGTVSFQFADVPIETAFAQLLEGNGLAASFNARTRTVTIGRVNDAAVARPSFVRRVEPLDGVAFAQLRRTLATLGLTVESLTHDPESDVVAVTGTERDVGQVIEVLQVLRQRTEAAGVQGPAGAGPGPAARAPDALVTRVFRLRFTSVGPTERRFQGRVVAVPGIGDTLQTLLGFGPDGGAPATPNAAPAGLPALPGGGATFRSALDPSTDPDLAQLLAPLTGGAEAGGAGATGQRAAAPVPLAAAVPPPPQIAVDPRTNSIIVRGTPEIVAAIAGIIAELDQPQPMIEIEVIIASVQLGVAEELGIAFRGSAIDRDGTTRGGGAIDTGTSGGRVANGGTGFSNSGFDALSLLPTQTADSVVASFVIRGAEAILQAQLRALAADNRARILSQPRVVTLDNVGARITRSQNIFVQVDTGGDNGQGLAEIATGLTLELTPTVIPPDPDTGESFVRLTLNAVNSTPSQQPRGVVDVVSQEVETEVMVPDGGTLVLGGLFDATQLQETSGVPGLRDLPLIGGAFRTDTESETLSETIFFITPRIVFREDMNAQDLAHEIGSRDYIRRQRNLLRANAAEMEGGAVEMPPASVLMLEEDE